MNGTLYTAAEELLIRHAVLSGKSVDWLIAALDRPAHGIICKIGRLREAGHLPRARERYHGTKMVVPCDYCGGKFRRIYGRWMTRYCSYECKYAKELERRKNLRATGVRTP